MLQYIVGLSGGFTNFNFQDDVELISAKNQERHYDSLKYFQFFQILPYFFPCFLPLLLPFTRLRAWRCLTFAYACAHRHMEPTVYRRNRCDTETNKAKSLLKLFITFDFNFNFFKLKKIRRFIMNGDSPTGFLLAQKKNDKLTFFCKKGDSPSGFLLAQK